MSSLLEQIKQRRIALDFKQHDMMLRVGISRQQYQRLEAKGNPRLDTLELIAKGLNSQLLLIPQEKLAAVQALLSADASAYFGAADYLPAHVQTPLGVQEPRPLSDYPWQGILDDDDEQWSK